MIKKIIFTSLIILAALFILRFLSPEDTWICQKGEWAKHGRPSTTAPQTACGPTFTPTPAPQLVGNDKDEHGCIGSAGYSWCAAKSKCLRIWEESCQ